MAITFVSGSSNGSNPGGGSTSIVVNAPTGVVSGDVLVAIVSSYSSANDTITGPTGWTRLATLKEGTNYVAVIDYKVAGGSEPTSYTWTTSAAYALNADISAWAGVDNTTPIDAHTEQDNTTASTNVALPSTSPTNANDMWLALLAVNDNATITFNAPPSGWTKAVADGFSNGIFYQLLSASGATGTATFSDNSAQTSVACSLTLKAAGASTHAQATFSRETFAVRAGLHSATRSSFVTRAGLDTTARATFASRAGLSARARDTFRVFLALSQGERATYRTRTGLESPTHATFRVRAALESLARSQFVTRLALRTATRQTFWTRAGLDTLARAAFQVRAGLLTQTRDTFKVYQQVVLTQLGNLMRGTFAVRAGLATPAHSRFAVRAWLIEHTRAQFATRFPSGLGLRAPFAVRAGLGAAARSRFPVALALATRLRDTFKVDSVLVVRPFAAAFLSLKNRLGATFARASRLSASFTTASRLTATFTRSPALAAPNSTIEVTMQCTDTSGALVSNLSAVSVTVTFPDGTQSTYTMAAGAVTNAGGGNYTLTYTTKGEGENEELWSFTAANGTDVRTARNITPVSY